MTALILTGLGAGLVNGLFGSGGGVIVVLALTTFCKTEKKRAHATAVAVILALSAVSLVFYGLGKHLDVSAAFLAGIGGAVGGFIGAKLLKKLPVRIISRIFGILMILSAWRLFNG